MSNIVLINPGSRKQIFQDLGLEAAAIEPPFWIAVMASYLREKGFSVTVIDANAENLAPDETAQRVQSLSPLLSAVIVYGSQPSASTQSMPSAGAIVSALKKDPRCGKVLLGGLHPSALPELTMQTEECDFVADGEGILTLEALLAQLCAGKYSPEEIGGLWYRNGEKICHTARYEVIEDLDKFLPVGAWDLLPMHLYRAHN